MCCVFFSLFFYSFKHEVSVNLCIIISRLLLLRNFFFFTQLFLSVLSSQFLLLFFSKDKTIKNFAVTIVCLFYKQEVERKRKRNEAKEKLLLLAISTSLRILDQMMQRWDRTK